jgi:putative endonuclease
MDNFVVYILYSHSSGKTYTGMTSDLINRFQFHNSKSTKGFTLRYRPWKVIHVEFFESKALALLREKILKSRKSRESVKINILPNYLFALDSYALYSAWARWTGAFYTR